jgi:hypothetical protein
MDFIILIVRLTTWKRQDPPLAGQLMLRDHRVIDTATIHTPQTGCPHLSKCALYVQEMVFYHEALAA